MNWKQIGESDYEAEFMGYYIRLELMDRNLWWFQVYHNDKEQLNDNNMAFTKEEAERMIIKWVERMRK